MRLLTPPKDRLPMLGQRPIRNPDDLKFQLARPDTSKALTQRHWQSIGILDQGSTSECVAYSTIKYLRASPVINKVSTDPAFIHQFYKECQRHDEWEGEDYDGTSTRASMKVLKKRGLISEYRWTWNVHDIIDHLLYTGPMLLGTIWTTGMFQTDYEGFLIADGNDAGGHQYQLTGVNLAKRHKYLKTEGAVRMEQTWGPWGDRMTGRAWIGFPTLETLINANGEAALPIEVRI